MMIPITITTAYGVDALAKRSAHHELSRVLLVAVAGVMAVIVIGLVVCLIYDKLIHWGMVLFMLIIAACFIAQYRKTRPLLLIGAQLIVLATISHPLILRQKLDQIAVTSPLLEKMQVNLPKNSRYAIINNNSSILPPNLNVMFGLNSIHTYNSLSSRRYHSLINALGGNVLTYGRHNIFISPDYNSSLFFVSNIGLILSQNEIYNRNLEYIGEESGFHFYKVISRMGDNLQVIPLQTHNMDSEDFEVTDIQSLQKYSSSKELDQGDLLEFNVTPGIPSVLILSQKFHPDWRAEVRLKTGWIAAKTIIVNGIFQGISLPKNTYQVRLQFKQFVSYAWVGHIFWFLLLIFLVFKFLQRKI